MATAGMPEPMRRAIRLSLIATSLASALCALSLLMLPLLLALLMLLFDSTAQALMVLLGTVAGWLRPMLPGGGLSPWRSLALDPGAIAVAAALRMAPCLAGLLCVLAAPAKRFAWALAALSWCIAALWDGRMVAIVLAPGLAVALLLASGIAAPMADNRHS